MWQSAGLLSCVRVVAKQTKYAHQPAKNWCARIYHLSFPFQISSFKITSFLINFRQLPCISSYKSNSICQNIISVLITKPFIITQLPNLVHCFFTGFFQSDINSWFRYLKNYSTIVFLCFSYTFWLHFVFRNRSSCSKFSSSWSNIRITSINCSFSRLS